MPLLAVSHRRQRQQSDCLATCVPMVLEYLRVPFQYNELLRLLKTQSFGTFFHNLRHDKWIYLHDPEFDTEPQKVSIGEFELAWLEQDYL